VAKKREPLQVVALHAEEDTQGRIDVILSATVRQDRALMVRLHHRVVDLLAEKCLLDDFADDVEERLAALGTDIISDFVADLLREAEAVVQQAKAPSAKGIRRPGSNGPLARSKRA
jgi:hypothetical protein